MNKQFRINDNLFVVGDYVYLTMESEKKIGDYVPVAKAYDLSKKEIMKIDDLFVLSFVEDHPKVIASNDPSLINVPFLELYKPKPTEITLEIIGYEMTVKEMKYD